MVFLQIDLEKKTVLQDELMDQFLHVSSIIVFSLCGVIFGGKYQANQLSQASLS